MHRRSLLAMAGLGLLAGCGPRASAGAFPATSAWPVDGGRAATADDYRWFESYQDLRRGFCFTWVQGLTPAQTLERLGTRELERVSWLQLVGSGDGEQPGADRYFFGVTRVDQWSLMVEDNGMLGTTDEVVDPLSKGTTLISHYQGSDGHGRLLVLEDQQIRLNFDPLDAAHRTGSGADSLAAVIDAAGFGSAAQLRLTADPLRYRDYCMESAFALTERLTQIPMPLPLLQANTYSFSVFPSPQTVPSPWTSP